VAGPGELHSLTFFCLFGGPAVLLWGLGRIQQKRLIENTPSSKVRSAAMGLVELQGTAKARKILTAPISGLQVCWWRCRVEELRSSGKNRQWVTIKETGSYDLFYLEDSTGSVLVNPADAEIHALERKDSLGWGSNPHLLNVLSGWGIDATSWFGTRQLRVIEECIPHLGPLYVLGEIMPLRNHVLERQQRFAAKLRAVKADPVKMKAADLDQDGNISPDEWEAVRLQQEDEFLREELERQKTNPVMTDVIVKAPADGPFVVSAKSEKDLLSSMAWRAPFGLFLGVLGSSLGLWLSLMQGWEAWQGLGVLGCGFVVGYFLKKLKGATSWASFSS
jgi:hypothetical protein